MTDRPGLPDAAQRDSLVGQALVGIVGPQGQTVFGTRGEHPVRLGDAARHEIIDHDAEIAVGAIEYDRRRTRRGQGCIETGDKPLRRSLFVAGGAVDLPCQKQPRQTPGLQRRIEFARVDMVVFDGIARTDHPHPLKAGNRGQNRQLHLFRQRGRNAVGIDRRVVESFRLQKDLMSVAVAEADDLVLDRRAIARSGALDLP